MCWSWLLAGPASMSSSKRFCLVHTDSSVFVRPLLVGTTAGDFLTLVQPLLVGTASCGFFRTVGSNFRSLSKLDPEGALSGATSSKMLGGWLVCTGTAALLVGYLRLVCRYRLSLSAYAAPCFRQLSSSLVQTHLVPVECSVPSAVR